ncbi:MAG: ribonuclease D [Planctomycetota bacterium]|nr:MAG: ribonuclease D [Planctomycetota bacterium]
MATRIPPDWPPVRTVDTPEALRDALPAWRRAPVLGVDTESNSFYAYHDRLCLLQLSTPEDDFIVDPLRLGPELRAINELFADPGIVKVFHSAEFDLMLLRKDLGAGVRGLFDTQVAMTLLRHQRTGLAALIESIYGLELSKKEQRSDWGRRPLTPEQIAYARVDTHFLPDLHRRLLGELVDSQLLAAADGEFRRLEREVLPAREPDPEGWRRLKGARAFDGPMAARLRRLWRWREETARERDLPPFRVLGNDALLDLAARPPADVRALGTRAGVGWNKARKLGAPILEALQAGDQEGPPEPAPAADAAERRRQRLRRDNQESLRRWRKQAAAALGLPSERLLHRRHLEEVARRLPRTREELLRTIPMTDWQREHLEASLLDVLARLPDPEQST